MNGRSPWLKLWHLWVPPAVVVLLNVLWLAGMRGAVLGRGSLLAGQVNDAQGEVKRLEAQLQQLGRTTRELADLQANLDTLREKRLASMHDRLVPFITDVVRRVQEAGLQAERIGYTASRDEKSGLVYFTAAFGVKGSYEQIRRCVFLLESSPQFVLLENLGLRGDDTAASLNVGVQLTVGTYFSDLDERLLKQLGVSEVGVVK
jgi:Tfp pilus assembly protein PilO